MLFTSDSEATVCDGLVCNLAVKLFHSELRTFQGAFTDLFSLQFVTSDVHLK